MRHVLVTACVRLGGLKNPLLKGDRDFLTSVNTPKQKEAMVI